MKLNTNHSSTDLFTLECRACVACVSRVTRASTSNNQQPISIHLIIKSHQNWIKWKLLLFHVHSIYYPKIRYSEICLHFYGVFFSVSVYFHVQPPLMWLGHSYHCRYRRLFIAVVVVVVVIVYNSKHRLRRKSSRNCHFSRVLTIIW